MLSAGGSKIPSNSAKLYKYLQDCNTTLVIPKPLRTRSPDSSLPKFVDFLTWVILLFMLFVKEERFGDDPKHGGEPSFLDFAAFCSRAGNHIHHGPGSEVPLR